MALDRGLGTRRCSEGTPTFKALLIAGGLVAFRLAAVCLLVSGCGGDSGEDDRAAVSGGQAEPQTGTEQDPAPREWTAERAHTVLKAANPAYNWDAAFRIEDGKVTGAELTGTNVTDLSPLAEMDLTGLDLRGMPVTDISALRGLPLVELYLEDTRVQSIEPLRGMNLITLYLSNTQVSDIRPLKGMPLETLNLLGTKVADLGPLRGTPLKFLWLNDTPVSDIAPLADCPLVSLTLHRTLVSDLGPLASSDLQRLHIGETPVRDLTPIRDLELTRLIFTPSGITGGLDIARDMKTLEEVGTTFENRMPPEAFWAMYDRGMFR